MSIKNLDEKLEIASADCFWVPSHVQVVERGEITYTQSPQRAKEYNRVLRVRPTDDNIDELVREVCTAHRGGASLWNLNPMSDSAQLRRALADAGYSPGDRHGAYAISVDRYRRDTPSNVEVREVETLSDLETLYKIVDDVFGSNLEFTTEDLQRELRDCTGPTRRIVRFIAFRNGEPAGSGGMTFFDSLSLGLIWAGSVAEMHRGHGVYTALLAARAEAARRRGIEAIGLYAREDTSAPIVAAHGFERHGQMVYFEKGQ